MRRIMLINIPTWVRPGYYINVEGDDFREVTVSHWYPGSTPALPRPSPWLRIRWGDYHFFYFYVCSASSRFFDFVLGIFHYQNIEILIRAQDMTKLQQISSRTFTVINTFLNVNKMVMSMDKILTLRNVIKELLLRFFSYENVIFMKIK